MTHRTESDAPSQPSADERCPDCGRVIPKMHEGHRHAQDCPRFVPSQPDEMLRLGVRIRTQQLRELTTDQMRRIVAIMDEDSAPSQPAPAPAGWRGTQEEWEAACEAVRREWPAAPAPDALRLGELLRTQDNRCTANPVFAVQQKRRIWGVEEGDGHEWRKIDEWEAVDAEKAAELERHFDIYGEVKEGFHRYCYLDVWEFVTACLTEQGCEDYIAINGHNLHEPRIYAYGGWRNAEWEFLRKYFMGLTPPSAPTPSAAPDALRERIERALHILLNRSLVSSARTEVVTELRAVLAALTPPSAPTGEPSGAWPKASDIVNNPLTLTVGEPSDAAGRPDANRMLGAAVVALAKIELALTNALREDEGTWPAGQEWNSLGGSSRGSFVRKALETAGINATAFWDAVRYVEGWDDDAPLDHAEIARILPPDNLPIAPATRPVEPSAPCMNCPCCAEFASRCRNAPGPCFCGAHRSVAFGEPSAARPESSAGWLPLLNERVAVVRAMPRSPGRDRHLSDLVWMREQALRVVARPVEEAEPREPEVEGRCAICNGHAPLIVCRTCVEDYSVMELSTPTPATQEDA